jgi:hypothetical protein
MQRFHIAICHDAIAEALVDGEEQAEFGFCGPRLVDEECQEGDGE